MPALNVLHEMNCLSGLRAAQAEERLTCQLNYADLFEKAASY